LAKVVRFTDLIAWQEGHKLVLRVYDLTKRFPSEEKFSLTSQIRRAGVSVTSNIAEGFGRRSNKDKLHFYTMSRGSLLELQNQCIIARDIGLTDVASFETLEEQIIIVHKLLNGLMRSIEG